MFLLSFVLPDATVMWESPSFSVGEAAGSVSVCAEISGVPAGGLEFEVVVSITTSDGTKAGEYMRVQYNEGAHNLSGNNSFIFDKLCEF